MLDEVHALVIEQDDPIKSVEEAANIIREIEQEERGERERDVTTTVGILERIRRVGLTMIFLIDLSIKF